MSKADDIKRDFDRIVRDPKIQKRAKQFARVAGTLTYEQLHRPFTI